MAESNLQNEFASTLTGLASASSFSNSICGLSRNLRYTETRAR